MVRNYLKRCIIKYVEIYRKYLKKDLYTENTRREIIQYLERYTKVFTVIQIILEEIYKNTGRDTEKN